MLGRLGDDVVVVATSAQCVAASVEAHRVVGLPDATTAQCPDFSRLSRSSRLGSAPRLPSAEKPPRRRPPPSPQRDDNRPRRSRRAVVHPPLIVPRSAADPSAPQRRKPSLLSRGKERNLLFSLAFPSLHPLPFSAILLERDEARSSSKLCVCEICSRRGPREVDFDRGRERKGKKERERGREGVKVRSRRKEEAKEGW